ncbi:MAG: hypothetical protein ACKV0T_12025 [Planctomycetales bacterium]
MPVRFACLFAVGLILAGCDNRDSQSEKKPVELPYAGQSLGIAVPAGFEFAQQWEGVLKEWGVQTGAELKLEEYPADRPAASFLSQEGGGTLCLFPLNQLGELLDQRLVASIPESVLRDDTGPAWLDLFAGLREGPASVGKRPAIIPLSCPVLVCYFRRDLLDQAGLNPPETWDDYQKLLESLDQWAPGLEAVEPWSPEFRATLFLARSAALARHPGHFSLFFEIESGQPLINGPGFVRGLEVAHRAHQRLSADSLTLGPAECRRRVLDGQAALALTYEPPLESGLSDSGADSAPESSRAPSMRIGCMPLPGTREVYNPTTKTWEGTRDRNVYRVTMCGFSGWGIAASRLRETTEIEAAWNAVSRLNPGGLTEGFPTETRSLCRESQLGQMGRLIGPGLDGGEAASYADAVATSLRRGVVVAELPVPSRGEFLAALSAGIGSVLEKGAPPQEALEEVQATWRQLVEKIGAERIRQAYRAALGLSNSPGR